MTPTAIVLLTISAVMHVAWNLGGRVAGPTPQFFRVSTGYAAILLAPLMLLALPTIHSAKSDVWLYIIMSGFFQAIYFSGLSRAYFSGHLSVAYPLARTWPALFVLLISFLRGHGDAITWKLIAGIVLILAGSTALPLGRLRELRLSTYANKSCAYALLAAVGTAGYTIVDDTGLRGLVSAIDRPSWQVACVWLGYESLAAVSWLWAFERMRVLQVPMDTPLKISRWQAVLVALGMGGGYTLVLISYTMVSDVSYAAGFRQLSVPLGAVAGVILLREPGPPLKFIGVTLMFAGLLFLALS